MMIKYAHSHHDALSLLRQATHSMRIATYRMLDAGARIPDGVIVIYDHDAREYAVHCALHGVLQRLDYVIRIIARPGVCVECGRVQPCPHQRIGS